jgi:hypothetical protein
VTAQPSVQRTPGRRFLSASAFSFTLALFGALTLAPASSAATPPADEVVFSTGVAALEKGSHDEAIDQFEMLADRGLIHPDASYNRGLAYAQRANSSGTRPGDLGQAAAAFEEASLLRRDDKEAPQALLLVRDELARSRSRRPANQIGGAPAFPQAIVTLIPEGIWALIALIGSITLAAGLLVRRALRTDAARLSAATAGWVGGVVFVIALSATLLAVHDRNRFDPGVTIIRDASLLDELGRPLTASPGKTRSLPEGTRVDMGEQRGRLTRVRWGDTSGWLLTGQLRQLAQP